MDVYINKISAKLPNEAVYNDQIEDVLGYVNGMPSRSKNIVLRSNGIACRYYAIDKTTGKQNYSNSQLSAEAVKGLLSENFTLDMIEGLVCATSYPDQILPGHGVMVHGELGNPPCEVITTSGVCVAGVSALKYGYLSIKSGDKNCVVTTASEVVSGFLQSKNFDVESKAKVDALVSRPEIAFEKDFLRWMLSDGAAAVKLSNQPNAEGVTLKIDWIDIISYADELPVCMYAGGEKIADQLVSWGQFSAEEVFTKSLLAIKQDVKLLNENIVPVTVEKALNSLKEKYLIKADDYAYFLPHYSSEYFRDKLYQGLVNVDFEIDYSRWFTNLTQKGNTGCASIFIMLEDFLKQKSLSSGQKILCYIPESGRFSSAFMQLSVVES